MARGPIKIPGATNEKRAGIDVWHFRPAHPITGKRESKVFADVDKALEFRRYLDELKVRRSTGDLNLDAEGSLAEYIETWWEKYATRKLTAVTQTNYSSVWNRHGKPRIGHIKFKDLSPQHLARFREELERDGVGAATIRKALTVIQSACRYAVETGARDTNPVDPIRKPSGKRQRVVDPLPPIIIERIRARLDQRDALIVSLMAYAGHRPEEVLGIEVDQIGKYSVLLQQRNVYGEIVPELKGGHLNRDVGLCEPLIEDINAYLADWYRPPGCPYLFARDDGKPWTLDDYKNFRRRRYIPNALAIIKKWKNWKEGDEPLRNPRPYDLRHTYASLLLHEGQLEAKEIAEELGHGLQMLDDIYGHIIKSMRRVRRRDTGKRPTLEEEITAARIKIKAENKDRKS